jgi:hypothetical protein
LASGKDSLRSAIICWIRIAHSTAETIEADSRSRPSPVVLTSRPPKARKVGVAASRRSFAVPGFVLAHEARIADDVGS